MASATALSALLQKTTIEDHEEVLRECTNALKTSKADPELLHIKIVALLKLDRHEEVLHIFKQHSNALQDRASFEHAYVLYKLGRLEDARKIASESSENRGLKHVLAQASYRAEEFVDAQDLYRDLIHGRSSDQDNESDLRINFSATQAQLAFINTPSMGEQRKPSREDLELFETAYNAACISIARGELGQGAVLLKRAQDVCQASEDLSDEEKAAEILPMRVQQLYVLTRQGKQEEARALAGQLTVQETSDLSTQQILRNNVVAAMFEVSNPYMERRKLDTAVKIPPTDRLFSYQTDGLAENDLVLDLRARKQNSVIRATDPIILQSQPTLSRHINSLSVLNAAARAQDGLAKQGLKQILPLFEKRPADVGLALTIIQLYLITKNSGSAINVLEKLISHLKSVNKTAYTEIVFAPGLVALQVSLLNTQNRKRQVKSVLKEAAEYWWNKAKPPTKLLYAAGATLLDSPDTEEQDLARKIYSTLRKADPNSRLAAAGFVATHAAHSQQDITEHDLSLLPSLEEQTQGIDVDALEEAGVPSLPDTSATVQKRPLDDGSKPSKKRHRHSKLPKDYDPEKKPDPERWLPMRERSSYRPPKKKGRKRDADRDRTQGGAVNEKPPEKGGEVSKASEKPAGAGAKNKGKKKGRK